jgi:hypothetical protein
MQAAFMTNVYRMSQEQTLAESTAGKWLPPEAERASCWQETTSLSAVP